MPPSHLYHLIRLNHYRMRPLISIHRLQNQMRTVCVNINQTLSSQIQLKRRFTNFTVEISPKKRLIRVTGASFQPMAQTFIMYVLNPSPTFARRYQGILLGITITKANPALTVCKRLPCFNFIHRKLLNLIAHPS